MVRTMQIKIEDSPANALDLCRDMSHVVVAGRNMMKIYSIEVSSYIFVKVHVAYYTNMCKMEVNTP